MTSPIFTIWRHPGATIARIAHENPGYRMLAWPILASLAVAPAMVLIEGEGRDDYGWAFSSMVSFSPLAELVQLFVLGYLLRVTGHWLGGHASSDSLRTAVAWANLPIVAWLPLCIVALVLYELFVPLEADVVWNFSPAGPAIVYWLFFALQSMLLLWSFVILLRGIATVQGFSVPRAIVNALLAGLFANLILVFVLAVPDFLATVVDMAFYGLDTLLPSYALED